MLLLLSEAELSGPSLSTSSCGNYTGTLARHADWPGLARGHSERAAEGEAMSSEVAAEIMVLCRR